MFRRLFKLQEKQTEIDSNYSRGLYSISRMSCSPSRVMSIVNFDRNQRGSVVINSPRSILACAQEGLDPSVDFVHKSIKDFILPCRGDKQAARMKCEHYMKRRDELIEIATHKRSVLIEAMEEAQSASRERYDEQSPQSSCGLEDGSQDGSAHHTEQSHQRREGEMMSKKEKLVKQIERMKQVVENNKIRQVQADEEAHEKLKIFAKQESERLRQKEHQELERKFKEVQLRRRAQQERQARQQREEEHAAAQEEQRRQRVEAARLLEEREIARHNKLVVERQRAERVASERQLDVALRLEAKRRSALEAERKRRQAVEMKMAEADVRRGNLDQSKEAMLEARKIASEEKTNENKQKREKAANLFIQRITRFEEKAHIADEQRKKQSEELQNYFLHCKLEEAKRERLRRDVLLRAQEEEAQREKEMQERLAAAEHRIEEISKEKARNASLRKVEKEMLLEDKLQQMLRNRRLLEHECLEGKARFEEKMKRITTMQEESRAADDQRRDLMRRSLLAIKKRDPEPTPGPADYATIAATAFVEHSDGAVKISTANRGSLFAKPQDSPGPGQYNIHKNPARGGKLKPITLLEKKRIAERSQSVLTIRFPERLSEATLPSVRPNSTPLHSLGVISDDYDSDEDFD